MKLYQYRINPCFDEGSIGFTFCEKIVEVRETKEFYICEDEYLINYDVALKKDKLDRVYRDIYSSLSPVKDKAINAFIVEYNAKKAMAIETIKHHERVLNMLESFKGEEL